MGVKHCLFKACEFAQGVYTFNSPAVLALTIKGNILSMSNHDLLPCQNLHSVKWEKVWKNNKPGTSASFWLWHQLLKITTLKIPGPELLAGRLRTFHTYNTRLPRHAKSWQAQLLGPLQDVLPLRLVVDVVTVDPQSAEHFLWPWRGRLFLRSRCCW